MSDLSREHVVIVGGGLAGLAAATALAPHGLKVTVLEARNRLGGRASSFQDVQSGETVDNCQHVSMGCCTALQQFCETVGIADRFRVEKELTFIGPDGKRAQLKSAPLPAPVSSDAIVLEDCPISRCVRKWSLAFALQSTCSTYPQQILPGRILPRLAASSRTDRASDRTILGDRPRQRPERNT